MKTVSIRNTDIGLGVPKTCVPVTGVSAKQILEQTKQAVMQHPDLLEWRADFYEDLNKEESVSQLAVQIRGLLGEIPLIFTVRTANEGGNCVIRPKAYRELLRRAAKMLPIDIIDVELFMDDEMFGLVEVLQKEGKTVIASNHHFHRTPSQQEMEEILQKMELAGADIRKLAVMPSSAEDVLTLLAATLMANQTGKAPVVTMSMGSLGAITRVSGHIFGSCMTFGTVGQASAPGQLELSDLKYFLRKLHQ